jgi:hypothetical protein
MLRWKWKTKQERALKRRKEGVDAAVALLSRLCFLGYCWRCAHVSLLLSNEQTLHVCKYPTELYSLHERSDSFSRGRTVVVVVFAELVLLLYTDLKKKKRAPCVWKAAGV